MTRSPAAAQVAPGDSDKDARFAALSDRCHRLVRFLHELASVSTTPVTSVEDSPMLLWLADLPDGLSLFDHAGPGEVLLVAPAGAALPLPPDLPEPLRGRVVLPEPGAIPPDVLPLHPGATGVGEDGSGAGSSAADADADEEKVAAAYREWLPAWQVWAARARADAERRALHSTLYSVAQRLSQQGDAVELVLATGLVSWRLGPGADARGSGVPDAAGSGSGSGTGSGSGSGSGTGSGTGGTGTTRGAGARLVRRHLLTTRLAVEVDQTSSAIRLRIPANAATRLEDGAVLEGVAPFRPERTNALHERLRTRDVVPLGGDDERLLRDWLALALDCPTEGYSPSWRPEPHAGPHPRLELAPALVLRDRGRAPLLNYYEQMLDALRSEGRPPLGLAQLVETIDAPERLAWLAAEGAASAMELGADPLFPLPTNPEQARVMERLRHDNGVVVEGPPGTGKTHTIANLVSALLAQGQRVLVTSQKAQALRVLRDKLPPDLRRLCVSLTDSGDTGSAELAASVSALAAEKAAYHPATHQRRIAAARARRDLTRQRRDGLVAAVRAVRAAEQAVHREGAVAPGWAGSRAGIAARVRREHGRHGWVPLPLPLPAPAASASPEPPPPTSPTGGGGAGGAAAGGGAAGGGAGSGAATPGWPPPAPLTSGEAGELLRLLRTRTATRRRRLETAVVDPSELVPAGTVRALLERERATTEAARSGQAGLGMAAERMANAMAAFDVPHLDTLRDIFTELVNTLGQAARHTVRQAWVAAALDDALAGRDAMLWAKARTAESAVGEACSALDEVGLRSVVLPPPRGGEPMEPTALLAAARGLREHLASGGRLRRLFKPRAQKEAAPLLDGAKVDGVAPRSAELLVAVEAQLRAQAALDAATRAWKLVGLDIEATLPVDVRAARFRDAQEALHAISTVVAVRDRALVVLRGGGVGAPGAAAAAIELDCAQACRDLAAAVDVARAKVEAAEATAALRRVHDGCAAAASNPDAPPELAALATALADRDAAAYASALSALSGIAAERADERRCVDLLDRLERAHPRLAALLAAEAADEAWAARLGAFEAAWAWGAAASWLGLGQGLGQGLGLGPGQGLGQGLGLGPGPGRRDPQAPSAADRAWAPDGHSGPPDVVTGWARPPAPPWADLPEVLPGALAGHYRPGGGGGDGGTGAAGADRRGYCADLDAELDAAEEALGAATADLASALAWEHCLQRMGAEQSAALRAYADAVAAGGTFTGRYADRYRHAAREAMRIAQTAVPAWVMPINEVLSTIPAVRDCFDVVIVDEGSQAGLDSLFLLWLAPRVIVVGDDRQCTPTEATFNELEPVFNRLDTLLPDVPSWLRVAFTPRSSLFTLLRTRFGEVIRLREHFRCMPEIIEWSSAMFYRDAPLVPLRQFGSERLPPLRSSFVPHGYTSPGTGGLRNPVEAEALVAQVMACASDPRYDGRSFGVVVLQGSAQADLVRAQLNARMSVAEQQLRRLRVGTPPDFQGDERDVVFLSLVIAPDSSTTSLTRLEYQRRFNVAASRARDQVWVFHSVGVDELEPADLRHSYLSYVLAHSHPSSAVPLGAPARPVPRPRDISADVPHPSFDTLFEQRVYLMLTERGYQVAPQVEVNGRRIDLVVSGGRARLAVECDGDDPAPEEQLAHDFARERELRRAGWRFVRIRQSWFELDPQASLKPLWDALAEAGITPVASRRNGNAGVPAAGDVPAAPVRAEPAGPDIRWSPIALNDVEGLDDAPELAPQIA